MTETNKSPSEINSIGQSPENVSLDPKKALHIFIGSFRFSQGDTLLQHKIFEYLHQLHPSWKITIREKDELIKSAMPNTLRLLFGNSLGKQKINHSKIATYNSPNMITYNQLSVQAEDMQKILNGDVPIDESNLIPDLTSRIIQRDLKYLTKPLGRDRSNPHNYIPSRDPWLSHICYFALKGKSTGIPEFDKMFDEIHDFLKRNYFELPENFKRKLDLIISIYNKKHPDDPVEISEDRGQIFPNPNS